MSFEQGQRVVVTNYQMQAGEVIGTTTHPATVDRQKGKWVIVELDDALPSSTGSFTSTKMIVKETDVALADE